VRRNVVFLKTLDLSGRSSGEVFLTYSGNWPLLAHLLMNNVFWLGQQTVAAWVVGKQIYLEHISLSGAAVNRHSILLLIQNIPTLRQLDISHCLEEVGLIVEAAQRLNPSLDLICPIKRKVSW